MRANLTDIRQSFTDVQQRWDNAKLKKSVVFWIAIGAVVLVVFLGFSRGGWMTESSASNMADTAVVERLTVICVAQFDAHPQRAQKLEELRATSTYQRDDYVTDQGWATMPGETEPDQEVATQCATQIALIGE
jgi:hypothetical protein